MMTATQEGYRVTEMPVKQFTVDQYHRMIDLGFFDDRARCELVRGIIVEIPRMNPPHASTIGIMMDLFNPLKRDGLIIQSQRPVTLTDSEPLPDIMFVLGNQRAFTKRHPGASELRLVIEVSDSTLKEDRTTKQEMYASEMIEHYWIVNLQDFQIEVYSQPTREPRPHFQNRIDYRAGSQIPLTLTGEMLGYFPVSEMLPV